MEYIFKNIDVERIRRLNELCTQENGPVVYWMSRDQRMKDNWAFLFAQEIAFRKKVPLAVVFTLVPCFLGATRRHYGFMLRGLVQVQNACSKKNIPFFLLTGDPSQEILKFVKKYKAGALVCDFDPLRIKRAWKEQVIRQLGICFYEVDAHNIVPCWIASPKQEFGAYTLRPKINRILDRFLTAFPPLKRHPWTFLIEPSVINPDKILNKLDIDQTVSEVRWIRPSEPEAQKMLKNFLEKKLSDYNDTRNDPCQEGQSQLSAYLHFGQVSAQRVAIEAIAAKARQDSKDAFLEELIIRRELADNFCFYNFQYDSFLCAPNWARRTLQEHAKDQREYCYTKEILEKAETHDELWNSAQKQMVVTGKMHGFMRMYWAKKIFEWTEKAEKAFEIAIYLNDKYELDGRDPNGYAGIAWSLAGVHDRAWGERVIFGKIRYMSYQGCKNKFDINSYIQKYQTKMR